MLNHLKGLANDLVLTEKDGEETISLEAVKVLNEENYLL